MKERQYLEENTKILLCEENGGADTRRIFTILGRISEGASVVCYQADCQKSGIGILKEFYPKDSYCAERDPNGQLVCSDGFRYEREDFLAKEKAYLEPYRMLLDLRNNGGNTDLTTFIPPFEIYRGCVPEGNIIGSAYIWTPEPELKIFKEVCDDIHEHPEENPEQKLVTVLNAIKVLTECIQILHAEGLLHRDITPANFGFKKRGGEILYQTLSLFDVNSICSVYDTPDEVYGTEGFMEPEAGREEATNQTDIYSIGATLFNAIIVTDEAQKNQYHYQQGFYDQIPQLVRNSRLITASEANAHPRLVDALTKILQRSLCCREDRYANCEQMIKDLDTALYYALPTEIAQKQQTGQKWVLEDVEKSLDENKEKNTKMAIQYHLYEHPLYQKVNEEDRTINVLLIGFGSYGQKFMDGCLQAGQIQDYHLSIRVISDNETDKKIYLQDRPALPEFFNIDGSLKGELEVHSLTAEDVYGYISFETKELDREDASLNAGVIHEIMKECGSEMPHYVFVALGDDHLNSIVAATVRSDIRRAGCQAVVSYVLEKGSHNKPTTTEDSPLYINTEIKMLPLYSEIERMAFNTHLVWEKNLDIDYQVVGEDSQKPYNHDSNVGAVLSLKYKLHSLGIDFENQRNDFAVAAKEFQEEISQNDDLREKLIWVEHRRWVAEKLCLGWTRREVDQCQDGTTKDETKKQHICLVRSRPDQDLKKWTHRKWDRCNKTELDELDDLDRLSVELHRLYKKEAQEAKRDDFLSEDGSIVSEIRSLIEGEKEAVVAFQEWLSCMRNIRSGDAEKVYLYEGLKQATVNGVHHLTGDKTKSVLFQIDALDLAFRPILDSMRYQDWKQVDAAMIDNIPFILTYDKNTCMAIPYSVSETDNTALFGNVVVPTIVNPGKILYLYHVESDNDIEDLCVSISGVIAYLGKKKICSKVEFLLAYEDGLNIQGCDDLIQNAGHEQIAGIRHVIAAHRNDLAGALTSYLLQTEDARNGNLVVERNSTTFSSFLDGAGFYDNFPCYEFDSKEMKYTYIQHCDALTYINKKPYIMVSDILALKCASGENNDQPEFYDDYQALWRQYCRNRDTWKSFCQCMRNYSEQNDIIAVFEREAKTEAETKTYEFIIPFLCRTSVIRILSFLKEQSILEGYEICGYTSDSLKVSLHDSRDNEEIYQQLFSQVNALAEPDLISVYPQGDQIKVKFNNLVVSSAVINRDKEQREAIVKLAQIFEKKHYIIHLVIEDAKISFTYATRQIKELFTTEGKILEIYTYHKTKEKGEFDDVVSGYEIHWQEGVTNEFDCILTKGFRTLIVECKERTKIDSGFYYKLSALSSKFGINAKVVLIIDGGEDAEIQTVIDNQMQRKRGNGFDIVTIWKQDEIENIGDTLSRVIEGTYEMKDSS